MSDYSFMKTGNSMVETNEPNSLNESELESIEVLLTLFISNAMINASNYVKYCDRNGITKTDLLYGLRYEVFEFFRRPNISQDILSMTKEYEEMKNNEEDIDKLENEIDDIIVPDDEIMPFSKILLENPDIQIKIEGHTHTYLNFC